MKTFNDLPVTNLRGYGLSGPHRVGKTTLMHELSRTLKLEPALSFASDVFKSMQKDPRLTLSFEDRLQVQYAILEAHNKLWSTRNSTWITDRTPLCFLSYVMNDSLTLEDRHHDQWRAYVDACVQSIEQHFHHIWILGPDVSITPEDHPLKGRASRVLQQCMYWSMQGVASHLSLPFTVVPQGYTTQARTDFIRFVTNSRGDYA